MRFRKWNENITAIFEWKQHNINKFCDNCQLCDCHDSSKRINTPKYFQVSGFSKLNLISISVLLVISVPTNTAHFFLRISYVCSHFVAKWSLKSYTRHTTWKNVKAYNWSYGRRQKISWQRKREWLLENVTCEFQYYHKKNIHKTVTRGIVNATGVSSH